LVNVVLLLGTCWHTVQFSILIKTFLLITQCSAALLNVLPNGQRYAALWTLLLIDQLSALCFLVKALLFF
jgi:hypothetical protein